MSLDENEQTKLTAAAVSNVGTSFIVTGFVVPVVTVSLRLSTYTADGATLLFSAVWIATGVALHVWAGSFPEGCAHHLA